MYVGTLMNISGDCIRPVWFNVEMNIEILGFPTEFII